MNINDIRAQTMGCEDKIFMNSAGSSLTSLIVNECIFDYLRAEELEGGYIYANTRSSDIKLFYSEAALLINASDHNISFQTSATDAYAKAFSAIPFVKGDCILTTNDDYISNQLAMISIMKSLEIRILRVKNKPNGDIDLVDFDAKMKDYHPKLVSITHIPTNSGKVQDIVAIGTICKKYQTWYIVDACQSIGQLEVDVKAIGCDFLTATGRKFVRGPRGTGFLFVSDKALEGGLYPISLDMRGASWTDDNEFSLLPTAQRFEYWEINYALLLGLTAAIRYINGIGMSNIALRNVALQTYFRAELNKISGLTTLDEGSQLCNIISIYPFDHDLQKMTALLDQYKIYYSITSKENAIIDFRQKKVNWAIRFSPHYFNTIDEINEVCQALKTIYSTAI